MGKIWNKIKGQEDTTLDVNFDQRAKEKRERKEQKKKGKHRKQK